MRVYSERFRNWAIRVLVLRPGPERMGMCAGYFFCQDYVDYAAA
jgi:hypothetical protein